MNNEDPFDLPDFGWKSEIKNEDPFDLPDIDFSAPVEPVEQPEPSSFDRFASDVALTGKAVVGGLYSGFADEVPKAVGGMIQRKDVILNDERVIDQMIARNEREAAEKALPREESERKLFGVIKAGDVYGGASSAVRSAVTSVPQFLAEKATTKLLTKPMAGIGAAVGGVPGAVAGAGGAVAAGKMVGGAIAYQMANGADMNSVLRQYRDNLKQANPDMTEAEWNEFKANIDSAVESHGRAEGLWEAVGNAAQIGILQLGGRWTKKLGPTAARRVMAVLGGMAVDVPIEVGSEAATEFYQDRAEKEMGLREQGPDLTPAQAVKNVVGQTLVTIALTMGAGGAVAQARARADQVRTMMENAARGEPEANDALREAMTDENRDELLQGVEDAAREDAAIPNTNPMTATPENPVLISNQPAAAETPSTPSAPDIRESQNYLAYRQANMTDAQAVEMATQDMAEAERAVASMTDEDIVASQEYAQYQNTNLAQQDAIAYAREDIKSRIAGEALASEQQPTATLTPVEQPAIPSPLAIGPATQPQVADQTLVANLASPEMAQESFTSAIEPYRQRQRMIAAQERDAQFGSDVRNAEKIDKVLSEMDRAIEGLGDDFVANNEALFNQIEMAVRRNNPQMAIDAANIISKKARNRKKQMRKPSSAIQPQEQANVAGQVDQVGQGAPQAVPQGEGGGQNVPQSRELPVVQEQQVAQAQAGDAGIVEQQQPSAPTVAATAPQQEATGQAARTGAEPISTQPVPAQGSEPSGVKDAGGEAGLTQKALPKKRAAGLAKAVPIQVEDGVGARKGTLDGLQRVEDAKQRLRDIINDPDIVGKQRVDMIANGKDLIAFYQANADTRKPLDEGIQNGDKIAYTGEDAPEGFRSFIYLDGANAGMSGVQRTAEAKAADVDRTKKEWQEQQTGFSNLRREQPPKGRTAKAMPQPAAPAMTEAAMPTAPQAEPTTEPQFTALRTDGRVTRVRLPDGTVMPYTGNKAEALEKAKESWAKRQSIPQTQPQGFDQAKMVERLKNKIGRFAKVQAKDDGTIDIVSASGATINVSSGDSATGVSPDSWNRGSKKITLGDGSEFNHELSHAMRDLGMITDKEWGVLVREASRTGEREAIRKRYADNGIELSEDGLDHEVVAFYVNEVANGNIDAGANRALVQKLIDFLKDMASAVGVGIGSAKRVVERTARGEQLGRVGEVVGGVGVRRSVKDDGKQDGVRVPLASQEKIASATRGELQKMAKPLGVYGNMPTEQIRKEVSVLSKSPSEWTRDEFDSIIHRLVIHHAGIEGRPPNVESIMSSGMNRGMYDEVGTIETGRGWRWLPQTKKGMHGFIFTTGQVDYSPNAQQGFIKGSIPIAHVVYSKDGQSIYDAIKESAGQQETDTRYSVKAEKPTKAEAIKKQVASGKYDNSVVVEDVNKRGEIVYRIMSGKRSLGTFKTKEQAEEEMNLRGARLDEAMRVDDGYSIKTVEATAEARRKTVKNVEKKMAAREAIIELLVDTANLRKEAGKKLFEHMKELGLSEYANAKDLKPIVMSIFNARNKGRVEAAAIRAAKFVDEKISERANKIVMKQLEDLMTKGIKVTDFNVKVAPARLAEISKELKTITDMMNMTQEMVDARIEDITRREETITVDENGQPNGNEATAEEIAEKQMLGVFGALKENGTFQRSSQAVAQMKEIIAEGRNKWKERTTKMREEHNAIADKAIGQLAPKGRDDDPAYVADGKKTPFRKLWNAAEAMVQATGLYRMMNRTDSDGVLETTIEPKQREAQNKESEMHIKTYGDTTDAIAEIFGIDIINGGRKEIKRYQNIIKELGRKPKDGEKTGVFAYLPKYEGEGKDKKRVGFEAGREIRVSKDEMLSLYLAAQQAIIQANQPFSNEPDAKLGKTQLMNALIHNGYNAETFKQMEKHLGEKAIELGDWMVDYMDTNARPIVDKVMVDMFGVSPDMVDGYFPLSRVFFGGPSESSGARTVQSMLLSWMKVRKNSMADFKPRSAVGTFMRHMDEVAHVSSHADVVRLVNGVFGSAKMQKAMSDQMGDKFRDIVNTHHQIVAGGGIPGFARAIGAPINKFVSGFSRAVTSSIPIMLKQMTSPHMMLAYRAPGDSVAKMIARSSAIQANPFSLKKFNREWANDPYFKTYWNYRYKKGWSQNTEIALHKDGIQVASLKDSPLFSAYFNFARWGDKTSVISGGVPVFESWYAHGKKNGMSDEAARKQAFDKVQEAIEKTQQSGASKDISYVQQHVLLKFLWMFASSPVAITSLYANNIRDIVYRPAKRADAVKNIALIHLSAALFSAVNEALFTAAIDDDDEWKRIGRNMALSQALLPFVGFVPFYTIGERIAKTYTDDAVGVSDGNRDLSSSMLPFTSVIEGVDRIIKAPKKLMNSDDPKEMEDALWMLAEGAATAVGAKTGMPLPPMLRNVRGVMDAASMEDQPMAARAMRAAGFGAEPTGMKEKAMPRGGPIFPTRESMYPR